MQKSIASSRQTNYTDRYKIKVGNQQFSVYTSYADDAENFQCQITEIHPYDLAEYYWIKKDSPVDAKVIKNGRVAGNIELREWDDEAAEEYHEDEEKFIKDLVKYMCNELRGYNKNIEPKIDHT